MLGQIGPTEFDLRFSLFGIPVRVHPLFWVAAVVLGFPGGETGGQAFALILVWTACLFVSILVHEMGHALTARHYGYPPEIVLYHMGGYAQFYPGWGYTMARAVLILLAGSGAGFVLYGVVRIVMLLLIHFRMDPGDLGLDAIYQLEWINLWWGLVNLLPVYPLDGGQISRHVLTAYQPRNGVRTSLQVSILVAGAVAFFMFSRHDQFAALLFGLIAFQNFQALQESGGGFH